MKRVGFVIDPISAVLGAAITLTLGAITAYCFKRRFERQLNDLLKDIELAQTGPEEPRD